MSGLINDKLRSLLEAGLVQTNANGEDYVVLKSVDAQKKTRSTASREREYAIKVSDLLGNVGVDNFQDLVDTPTYPGNELQSLRINAAGTGLETYTPTDQNTADYPGVAFVDPNGNNVTGTVGDANLPYFSIYDASLAASYVVVKPGTYSQTVTLVDGVTYYFMPGAVMGGSSQFRDLSATGKVVKILGSLEADSTAIDLFNINSDIDLTVEFDRLKARGAVLTAKGSAKIRMAGRKMEAEGFVTAFGLSCRDSVDVEINLKEGFESWHVPVFFRANATAFSGKFVFNGEYIKTLPNSYYGNSYKSTVHFDQSNGAVVEINADIINEHTAQGSGDFSGTLTFVNQLTNGSKVTVRGNIIGNNNEAVRTAYRARYGQGLKIYNGEISTNNTRSVLGLYMTSSSAGDFPIYFQGCRFEGLSCNIWAGRKVTFKDCTFYNNADQGVFPDNPSFNISSSNLSPTATIELYLHDCILWADVTVANETFANAPLADFTLGCTNVRSNNSIGATAVDTYGGFAQVATLKVPQI